MLRHLARALSLRCRDIPAHAQLPPGKMQLTKRNYNAIKHGQNTVTQTEGDFSFPGSHPLTDTTNNNSSNISRMCRISIIIPVYKVEPYLEA